MIYFFIILAAFILAGYLILRDKIRAPATNGGSVGGGGSERPNEENDFTRPEQNEETL